jgi:hypothetical protein
MPVNKIKSLALPLWQPAQRGQRLPLWAGASLEDIGDE